MTNIRAALDYSHRATLHRPHDASTLAREIHTLARAELTTHDIACALRLSVPAVRSLLNAPPNASVAIRGAESAALHVAAWTKPDHAGDSALQETLYE